MNHCVFVVSIITGTCQCLDVSLTSTHQLGTAARSLWQLAGLDTISGCLATSHHTPGAGHQLGAWTRVTSPL